MSPGDRMFFCGRSGERPGYRLTWRHCRALLLFGSILAGLAGCATTPTGPERVAGKEDPLQVPVTEPIGLVVHVEPAEQVALIEVQSARTRLAPVLVTRNEALIETGRLEPTRFQRGRILGARILSGLPNVGDEVILDH